MHASHRQELIILLAELLYEWAVDLNDEHTRVFHWDDSWSLSDVEELAGHLETVRLQVQDAVARKQTEPA